MILGAYDVACAEGRHGLIVMSVCVPDRAVGQRCQAGSSFGRRCDLLRDQGVLELNTSSAIIPIEIQATPLPGLILDGDQGVGELADVGSRRVGGVVANDRIVRLSCPTLKL